MPIGKYKFSLLLFLNLWIFYPARGQEKFSLSGQVLDINTKDPLIGATILVKELSNYGTLTDVEGNFTLQLNKGKYQIEVSYLGYKKQIIPIEIPYKNKKLEIRLEPDAIEVDEVIVQSKRADENIKNNEMSRIELKGSAIKDLPVLFGETDVLKTITLLPGIKSGGEGNGGIYVRGGGPDQNLVLMDEGVVYNASHLLGFFSVFNGDAVDQIDLIKGGMPAEYGGRLSSIINVKMKEGDLQKHSVNGGIGLISSRISAEGPIKKNKSSYLFSARRTYADAVARPFLADSIKGNRLFFYDMNAKITWLLSTKDKLTLSAYYGRDVFDFISPDGPDFKFGVAWGNQVYSLRWLRAWNTKLNSSLALVYNSFDLETNASFFTTNIRLFSGLKDWNLKGDINYELSKKIKFKTGFIYTYHTFSPGALNISDDSSSTSESISNQFAHEGAVYLSGNWDVNPRFNIDAGLRYSHFVQVGPYSLRLLDNNGFPTGNSLSYADGEPIANYGGLEPRLGLRYLINESSSIKASYTRTLQYLHLATSSSSTLPTDLWVPSSKLVRPQIAYQTAIGFFKNFKDNTYETSVELYHKPMLNQIEFKPGAQLFLNENLEQEMIFGQGLSYGVELLIRKNKGNLTGWIGYTLSKTTRQFDEINNGQPYLYRYDRRHDVSVVLSYKINNKWKANFVFVYGSGNLITLPTGRYPYAVGFDRQQNIPVFRVIDLYTDINTWRMPAYHRADVSFNYTPNPESTKRFKSSWNFSIYNIYNRANPYFIYFDPDLSTGTIKAKMVYLFPVLPSVSWNFKF